MADIGFVGLGHMGLPMALNLVKAGHQVLGYDLDSNVLKHFFAEGGLVAHSLEELAQPDLVITMLQKGNQVFQVCQDLFPKAGPDTTFIDCSTIDVQTSRLIHQKAKQHHLLSLDAPVSGGIAGAKAASLTFMVGGDEQTYLKVAPVLALMGKKIIYTGQEGSGQAAKICNNMILGVSMIAISEAFHLAQHLGLSAEKLFEVVNNSSGQCWALSKYVPVAGILDQVPANQNFKAGFAAAMMLKDLNLSQESADAAHIETPLGAKARALYQDFVSQGHGDIDFSAIINYLSQLTKE